MIRLCTQFYKGCLITSWNDPDVEQFTAENKEAAKTKFDQFSVHYEVVKTTPAISKDHIKRD